MLYGNAYTLFADVEEENEVMFVETVFGTIFEESDCNDAMYNRSLFVDETNGEIFHYTEIKDMLGDYHSDELPDEVKLAYLTNAQAWDLADDLECMSRVEFDDYAVRMDY